MKSQLELDTHCPVTITAQLNQLGHSSLHFFFSLFCVMGSERTYLILAHSSRPTLIQVQTHIAYRAHNNTEAYTYTQALTHQDHSHLGSNSCRPMRAHTDSYTQAHSHTQTHSQRGSRSYTGLQQHTGPQSHTNSYSHTLGGLLGMAHLAPCV